MIYPEEHLRFIKDIERCPYLPKDAEYDSWRATNERRIEAIENERRAHIEALEADGFFILSHDEAKGLLELKHTYLDTNNFAGKRAIRRLINCFTTSDYVGRK